MSPTSRALAAAVAALALAAPAAAQAEDRSCGWTLQVSPDQTNILFPDEAATYWVGRLPAPQNGGHVEIKGRFPYARYTSLVTYTSQWQAIDGIHDAQIAPDKGSKNPFLPRADRTVSKRDYTVRILNERMPEAGRATNTLYTENADGSKSGRTSTTVSFVLRIYEGDLGRGRTGGVPLPDLAMVLPTGERVDVPTCPDTNRPDPGLTQASAGAGLRTSPPNLGLFATNPPTWGKFTNFASSVVGLATRNEVTGDVNDALRPQTDTALPSGGFAENPDNKYVSATFSSEFGEVLELRAKAPTYPATRDGQKRMGTGQVRYWSLCTNAQTTAFYGCRQDDQIPLDRRGFYRVVVSTAAARPANATTECGVAWLPAGPHPQSILILRNMLASPTFTQSIQNATPGDEAKTMREYLPAGRYYATAAEYEAKGC